MAQTLTITIPYLARPFAITDELLDNYQMVIRAGAYSYTGYSEDEKPAYPLYVDGGGTLILLADHTPDFDRAPGPDLLAMHFGLILRGNVRSWVDNFTYHPITEGIASIYYPAGSVLVEDPPPYTVELGFIDGQTVMGILPYGFGQVFFMGDTHEVVFAQQPLTDNLIAYFLTTEGLMSQVLQAELDADAESGLLDKLEAAMESQDDGRLTPMNNQLQAFINQVEALRSSGRLDSVVADQLIGTAMTLMSIYQPVSEPICPCWSPEDIAALPMKKTDANCIANDFRFDILQVGGCEHSFGVSIDASGDLSCVANRFDCPKLPDLGGEFIETNESEFLVCTSQIISRCEDLGIEPPDYP